MNWAAYENYWSRHWEQVGERWFVTDMEQPVYDDYLLQVFARFAGVEVRSIIDLGCGNGLAVPALRRLWPAASYTGMDICAQAIANARAKYPDETWVVMDGPELAGTADLIVVHSVFTHISIEDTAQYLVAIGRALNPGGRASLSIHTDTTRLVEGSIGRVDIAPAYFEQVLAEHGYRILSVYEARQRYYEVELC